MVSVYQRPQRYQPAYNPYVFVFNTTEGNQPNYKSNVIVSDATDLNNVNSIYVGNYPLIDNRSVVDLTRVVRSLVTYDFDLGLTLASNCPNSIKRIKVEARDYYGQVPSPTGAITNVQDPEDPLTIGVVWNGSLQPDLFSDYNVSNYVLRYGNYSLNRYLTKAPIQEIKCALNQNGYVYVLCDNINDLDVAENIIDKVVIKTYNSSNNLIGEYEVDIDTEFDFNTLSGYLVRIPIGTYNIANISLSNITVISGTTPILTNQVSSYTVQLKSPNNDLSYPIKVSIVSYCDTKKVFRLHWLNRLGGFDCFNFSKYYSETTQIGRTFYQRSKGYFDNGWIYEKKEISNANLVNTATKQFTIESDWISDDESVWLEELLTSPIIYLEQTPESVIPVTITDNAYQTKYNYKDKLFNLSLTIETSARYISQTN